MSFRVGLGYDIHPFGAERPLVLGGVTLDGPGLVGHSDSDVVAHAVADAVLGVTGLGDLGTLFPATDEQLRGVSSMDLLADVVRRVAAESWWLVNVDVVIAAERPKLAPFVGAMAERLTEVLRVAQEPLGPGVFVSVKPKRGEGIDAVGRGEAVACWAVAFLERA